MQMFVYDSGIRIHGMICDVGAHAPSWNHLIPDASGHTFCINLAPLCAPQGYCANPVKG